MKNYLRTIIAGLLTVGINVTLATTTLAASQLAKAGEVVVRVPAGQQPDSLAATVGCIVLRPVAYCPGYYVFILKDYKATQSVEVPSPALLKAVSALRQLPGVAADPNWMAYPTGYKPSQQRTLAKPSQGRVQQPTGTRLTPNDSLHSREWGMEMIRMPEAWNIQFGSVSPVRVAIIDSGIDSQHPEFKDANGVSRIIAQQDFSGANNPSVDTIGHGTHVAGTVGATTNNGVGVSGVAGWARNGVKIQFINAKCFDSGGSSAAVIASAISYSVSQGAHVLNMSLGFPGATSQIQVITDAVNSAIRSNAVVVAAAGNDNLNHDDPNTPGVPSDLPGVIKVTSVGPTKAKASYSNYGGNPQKIAAPGGDGDGSGTDPADIWSTVPVAGSQIAPASAGGYAAIAGTSMACPHVAGAAALLLAAGAPPGQIYPTLSATAQPVVPANIPVYGPGIMDVYSALFVWTDPDPAITIEGPQDRGNSYFGATPISVSLVGVSKIIAGGAIAPKVTESDVVVEIQTISRNPTVLFSYTGGRNVTGQPNRFEIPTLTTGSSKAQRFSGIPVPALAADGTYTPPKLPAGQYKIVAKVRFRDAQGKVTEQESIQFITVTQKSLSTGRTMFALPFQAGVFLRNNGSASTLTPESAILGKATSFALARYNPLRSPSDDDYARYHANDPFGLKSAARFDISNYPDGRIVAFDTTDPNASIAPIGLGYWLDLDQASVVDTSLLPYPGQLSGVNPIATNSVGIKAYATGGGWNMIGAPFTYPVDWSVVAVVSDGISYSMTDAVNAGILSPALIGYANGDYVYSVVPSGQLEAFNAYWIRVYKDCTIVVPPVPSAVISRSRASVPTADGWRARLIASVGGDVDGQNYFGQASGAKDTEDRFDILKPPAGAGHAYVRFVNEGVSGKTRSLAFDLRTPTTTTKQEWTALVSTDRPNANVQLSWDGVRSAPRNARLILRDQTTGQVIPMAGRSSYTFKSGEAGSTRVIKITLEQQLSGGGLAIQNLRTASGRAVAGWAVRFNTNIEADIQGHIETISGRSVGLLTGATRSQAGTETTLRWDGRNREGALVPAGPYVVKLTARSSDGQLQTIQRMIQIVR